MKSLASLCLIVAALPAAAQEPPPGDGPRGSSQLAAGETRYDAVGFAGVGDLTGVSAASATLLPGSYAEVTALDSGKTIVVAIVRGDIAPGRVATLSPSAAAALGVPDGATAIRFRKVVPSPQDVAQLRGGQGASFRADAPPSLLAALRKMLPTPAASVPPAKAKPRPAEVPKPVVTTARPRPTPSTPVPRATSGYVVQVAALSSAARAAAVAKTLGGTVIAGPPLWRVRLGPFADAAAATRARDEAARRGYPGGQITRIP